MRQYTPCGTRTRNLRIRSPTPCPLGQGGLTLDVPFPMLIAAANAKVQRTPPAKLTARMQNKNTLLNKTRMTPVGFEPTPLRTGA
jgi:hypothetical protein